MNQDSQVDPAAEALEWMRTTAALRRVARSVGASGAEAEDVAQSTLLAALRERARGSVPGSLPGSGWLRTAARHRAIDWLRRAERRKSATSEHDLEVQPAPTPAPPELALQFEVQRSLMTAVEDLPEPYREVIFLRYFEEVAVPEIARRKGVPVPTVRTWLTRAHGRLRERLIDPDRTTTPGWVAAFLEFGRGPSGGLGGVPTAPPGDAAAATSTTSTVPLGSATAATFLMSFKTLTAAVLAISVLGLGWKLATGEGPADGPEPVGIEGEAMAPAVALPSSTSGMASVESTGARESAAAIDEPDEVAVASAPVLDSPVRVRGLVLDGHGQPVEGLRVRFEPELEGLEEMVTSRTGEVDGMTVARDEIRTQLVPVDDGMAVLFKRGITPSTQQPEERALLAVVPALPILGSVFGEDGEAIIEAAITLGLPEDFATRFGESIGGTTFSAWEASSALDGTFEVAEAPAHPGCSLTVSAKGYRTEILDDLPLSEDWRSSGELVVTLDRQDPLRIVRGVVLDPLGKPVPEARVGLGLPARITDATGAFEFELDGDDGASTGPQRLLASAVGWCPVEFAPDAAEDGSVQWPEFVELRFQREALSIEGVVLDREGQPKAGLWVWVDDVTVIGANEHGGLETVEHPGLSVMMFHDRSPTDEEGRFKIDGLAARDYTLIAMDPETLLQSQPTVISAGDPSAILQLDLDIELVDLIGRVVDRAGAPIEGVSLGWERWAQLVPQSGANSTRANLVRTESVRSGVDGRFTFHDVPLDESLRLRLSRQDYQSREIEATALGPVHDNVTIVLGAQCRAKAFGGEETRSVRLLDIDGNAIQVWSTPTPNSSTQSDFLYLTNGVSLPFSVSDVAVLAEFRGGERNEVLSTKSIRLEPGKLNEIRQ